MSEKILLVGPAWVGDMVMAQCLFKLIKQKRPDAVLDVLAPAWSLPLLQRMPEINEGIIMPLKHGELDLRQRYQLGKSLRPRRYDQAILLPNSLKSGLIPFFANIPVRTGWRGEMRFGLLNDLRRLDKQRYPLMIERFMALGLPRGEELSGVYPLPELHYTPATQQAVLNKYQLNLTSKILALCPGAEFGAAKRWPEDHYAQVANAKLAAGWQVWLLGSPKDQATTDQIMALTEQRCVNLAGRTSLVEVIDLLSCASAVISNDSGLMHIAAALHKPLVAIYGPTSTTFTPPLHREAAVLQLQLPCQPCFQRECPLQHHRCMRDLPPAQVLNVLRESV